MSWPHAGYRWAQPDPMAQAGFYHQVGSVRPPSPISSLSLMLTYSLIYYFILQLHLYHACTLVCMLFDIHVAVWHTIADAV